MQPRPKLISHEDVERGLDEVLHDEPIPFAWITPMKFIAALIFTGLALFSFLAVSGCGCLVIYDTKNGNIAAIKFDFLEDVNVASYRQTERGVTIEKGSSVVNDAAVSAVVQGVVEGLAKSIKP